MDSKQRPNAFDRIGMDLMEAVTILGTGKLSEGMVDGFMVKALLLQPAIDLVLISKDKRAWLDRVLNKSSNCCSQLWQM